MADGIGRTVPPTGPAVPAEQTAVLVLRLWREGPDLADVRVRVTRSHDVLTGRGDSLVTADLQVVYQAVRDWVEHALGGGNDPHIVTHIAD